MLYCKSTLVVSCTSLNTQISNLHFLESSVEMGLKPRNNNTPTYMVAAIKLTDRWIDRGNVSLFNKMVTEDKKEQTHTQPSYSIILLDMYRKERYMDV